MKERKHKTKMVKFAQHQDAKDLRNEDPYTRKRSFFAKRYHIRVEPKYGDFRIWFRYWWSPFCAPKVGDFSLKEAEAALDRYRNPIIEEQR